MTNPILPPTDPNAQAKADVLRRQLKTAGFYFTIDLSADDTHPEDLRAELAELAGRLHPNDLACLWLQARQFEGTTPDVALWTGPRNLIDK